MSILKYSIKKITTSQYQAYCDAMLLNDCTPLSEERYISHIVNNCVGFETQQGSGIYGEFYDEIGMQLVFISHWAPMSMRDGVKLLKKVLHDNVQVFINVLPGKMVDMLMRIGFYYHGDIIVEYPKVQTKSIMSNKPLPGYIESDVIHLNFNPDKYEVMAIDAGFNY